MNLRQLFLANLAQTSKFPLSLEINKAEGIYLFDALGKSYIDFISGIAVSNVGHRHPAVLTAIQQQLEKYLHVMVYGEYIQSPQVILANKIAQTLEQYVTPMGQKLSSVYFTNSGTEAVEAAMKLVKRVTQRTEIISAKNAYHGSTQGALSLGEEHFKNNFRPLLPQIRKIERNNFASLEAISEKTAAVFFEPIGGEVGAIPATNEFMMALAEKCKECGTLLVFDEIQSGFGRTGKFWAFEHSCVVPDIVLAAKGMGGGMPIGAVIASHEVLSVFTENPILGHITTFGGHPVSCAASIATIDVLVNENLIQQVSEKEKLIRTYLVHPKIEKIEGKGLMLAAKLGSFQRVQETISNAIPMGLITDWFLYCDDSIRIAPPLTITEEEIKISCEILRKALEE
jgi:acetylornithine/N-succinyldiaminopimelate aminotransferase